MTAPLYFSNPAVWKNLESQAESASLPPGLTENLPAVSPEASAWKTFQSNPAHVAPYIDHLRQSITSIQDFIQEHAAQGPQKTGALASLRDFQTTRVDCKPYHLNAMMVNENRRNLHLIACQLQNKAIPLHQRTALALTLTEGLNVCAEGTCLNILNCATQLTHSQQGLTGLIIRTKNALVDQHLLHLVRQQDSGVMSEKLATSLEIHHLQSLKNHVAADWGLEWVADRHATVTYQKQAGAMAEALLKHAVTPRALAEVLADKLANDLVSLTTGDLRHGMPAAHLKTAPLLQALQLEFGQHIDLEQCLALSEDYSQVKLQSHEALTRHVLQLFQQCGLVPAETSIDALIEAPLPDIQQAIEDSRYLQGPIPHPRKTAYSAWNTGFWYGKDLMNMHQAEDPRDARRKRDRHH